MSAVSVATLNQRVDAANAEVFDRIVAADPVLVDIAPAGDVIPGMQEEAASLFSDLIFGRIEPSACRAP